MTALARRDATLGLAVVAASLVIFFLASRTYDAGRGDFFYLADAFLHGRTWLETALGPWDIISTDGRIYVPFAPFPAVALMPVVALMGPAAADALEPLINAILAATSVGLCWVLLDRIGVPRRIDRVWLTLLFGFSTQLLWVTTRGGVWHTGHLVATILTFVCLLELFGARRTWFIGLVAGAAFLTRPPLAFAIPIYALLVVDAAVWSRWTARATSLTVRVRDGALARQWISLSLGVLPSLVGFFLYNQLRFGSVLESGYGIAVLPDFLDRQRAIGLFALAHVPMNLDYFLVHLPVVVDRPPYLRPDGFGLSVFITSPGLLYALRADYRAPRVRLLALAALIVLAPTLLYYGGGWIQFGYRYFLDSVPFVIVLCGLAAVRQQAIGLRWKLLIAIGVVVMATSIPFAHLI